MKRRILAQGLGISGAAIIAIGLPGIPGIPPVQNVIKGAALQQATKALGVTLTEEAPLRLSSASPYPTVAQPPGGAFGNSLSSRARVARDGSITLGPGDYQLGVQVFCLAVHLHSPSQNTFSLAPLQGKWADIISAVQTRGTLAGVAHPDLQMLSWQLQAGMKYQELSSRSRSLVDSLIPEYRSRLNESYFEQIQGTWNKYASQIPGVPSLDSMLGQMGDVGQAILQLEQERDTLIGYQNDYQYVANLFAPAGTPGHQNGASTLWSVVAPNVYARLIMAGDYRGPGQLEVRVANGAAMTTPLRLASAGLIRSDLPELAQDDGVPGGMFGLPDANVQPLGVAPEAPTPGPSPSPSPCDSSAYGGGTDGVPGGHATHPFNPEDPKGHPGTDVFAPRDTPVYADIQPTVSADDLNKLPIYHNPGAGLGIPETGDLTLKGATVQLNPGNAPSPGNPGFGNSGYDWGGVVQLTLTYQGGSGATYQILLDYLHLINSTHHPQNDAKQWIDNKGDPIGPDDYNGCIGYGNDMKGGAKLSPDELARHPLIGYLGATQTSHTHIQAIMTVGSHSFYFDPQPLLESN